MDILDHPTSGFEIRAMFLMDETPAYEAEPGNPATRVPVQRTVTLEGIYAAEPDNYAVTHAHALPASLKRVIENYIAVHYNEEQPSQRNCQVHPTP